MVKRWPAWICNNRCRLFQWSSKNPILIVFHAHASRLLGCTRPRICLPFIYLLLICFLHGLSVVVLCHKPSDVVIIPIVMIMLWNALNLWPTAYFIFDRYIYRIYCNAIWDLMSVDFCTCLKCMLIKMSLHEATQSFIIFVMQILNSQYGSAYYNIPSLNMVSKSVTYLVSWMKKINLYASKCVGSMFCFLNTLH